jgi:hypothetical protein
VQTTALDQLTERLLRQLLEFVTDPEQNALLRRAANEAAALIWLTPCPLFLFPELLRGKSAKRDGTAAAPGTGSPAERIFVIICGVIDAIRQVGTLNAAAV